MNKFSLYLPNGKVKPLSMTSPTRNIEPQEFYDLIRSGQIQRGEIDQIRSLSTTKDEKVKNKELIDPLKKSLGGSRMSGTFVGGINDDNLLSYSYRIVVDFDYLYQKLSKIKDILSLDNYVESVFISNSGQGLAAVIPVDIGDEQITKQIQYELFFALEKYFFDLTGEWIDEQCKNLSRFRFLSYDPEIYVNMSATPWSKRLTESIKPRPKKSNLSASIEPDCMEKAFEIILSAPDGELHDSRKRASFLVGGYVGAGLINAKLAYDTLMDAVHQRGTSDPLGAEKTIRSGINKGRLKPIQPNKPNMVRPNGANEWWWPKYNAKGEVTGYEYSMAKYTQWLTSAYNVYRYTRSNDERLVVAVENGVMRTLNKDTLHDLIQSYFFDKDTLHSDIMLNSTRKREFFDVTNGLVGLADVSNSGRQIYIGDQNSELLFFQNCIVKVSKNGPELIQYDQFKDLIWDKKIIKRDYKPMPSNGEYERFVRNISGDGFDSFRSAFGYMMHSHKSQSTAKMVLIHDQNLEEKGNGGTGKSLFVQALRYYRSYISADGKRVKSDDSFLFENVSEQTDVLHISDLKRGFVFETLYNKVTGDWDVNRKRQNLITIPFKQSPKIIADTNFTLRKSGNSDERRLFSLEVTNYYGPDKSVRDEFGHDIYNDWVGDLEDEWCKMDAFVIGSIQLYLSAGLIKQKFVALAEKEFIAEVGEELVNYLDENSQNGVLKIKHRYEPGEPTMSEFNRKDIRKYFIHHLMDNNLNDRYYRHTSESGFMDRVERWAAYRNLTVYCGRTGVNRIYRIYDANKVNIESLETTDSNGDWWNQ